MSNNSFLKPNNRFHPLDDSISNKNIRYQSTQNSKYKGFRERQNNFKSKSPFIQTVNIDANDLVLFPKLLTNVNTTDNSYNVISSTKFKDIMTKIKIDEKSNGIDIDPGWVKLSSVNGKTVIEYGPLTECMKKQKKIEEIKKQQEDDLNYNMFKAIEAMKANWDNYELQYDSIHGEGAFDDRFKLTPIYGPEYDTDSGMEDEEEDDYEEETY
jgi:hypothetical protein